MAPFTTEQRMQQQQAFSAPRQAIAIGIPSNNPVSTQQQQQSSEITAILQRLVALEQANLQKDTEIAILQQDLNRTSNTILGMPNTTAASATSSRRQQANYTIKDKKKLWGKIRNYHDNRLADDEKYDYTIKYKDDANKATTKKLQEVATLNNHHAIEDHIIDRYLHNNFNNKKQYLKSSPEQKKRRSRLIGTRNRRREKLMRRKQILEERKQTNDVQEGIEQLLVDDLMSDEEDEGEKDAQGRPIYVRYMPTFRTIEFVNFLHELDADYRDPADPSLKTRRNLCCGRRDEPFNMAIPTNLNLEDLPLHLRAWAFNNPI